MEAIYAAANAAARAAAARPHELARIRTLSCMSQKAGLSQRLNRFYVDDTLRCIDVIITEMHLGS